MEEQLQEIFSTYGGREEELIPVLQAVQGKLGYLPDEAMQRIAEFTRVPESRVFSVATFYTMFRFSPIGRHHCMVCRGTACHVKGAPRILEKVKDRLNVDEGETTEDGEFSLETVACIGACGLAPTMVINESTFGRLTKKRVEQVIDGIYAEAQEGQE